MTEVQVSTQHGLPAGIAAASGMDEAMQMGPLRIFDAGMQVQEVVDLRCHREKQRFT